MSYPGTLANQRKAEEIHQDQWIPFLARFTRENRGAHARLEIVGTSTDIGSQVETENRPFDGVAADIKDRERVVWMTFGTSVKDHMTHGIQDATVIRTLSPSEGRGAVLEVESADGTKSILELTLPGEFELPQPGR